jgi:hypothetical protein
MTITTPGFSGLSIIRSSSTPLATSRPGLDRHRSTKEQRPHVVYRGSYAHRTQGLSSSHHRRHHDTPGMTGIHKCTSPQQPLQRPPRLHLQGITLGFFRTPRSPFDPIKERTEGSPKEEEGHEKQDRDLLHIRDQHLKQDSIFSFLET